MHINFAYGSNMALSRIRARLPKVKRLGVACLKDFQLIFNKAGWDGSGKCDVTPEQGEHVWGVLYALSDEEKAILDDIEGTRYQALEISVTTQEGEQISCYCYKGKAHDDALPPFDWYINHVWMGAKENQFPLRVTGETE